MTRYADSPFWAPEVAAALDLFSERKAAAQSQANNLMLHDELCARARAERDVYGYAELRLQALGEVTPELIEEVAQLRSLAGERARAQEAVGSPEYRLAVSVEQAYDQVETILIRASSGQPLAADPKEAMARAICTALGDNPDAQDEGQE